MDVLISDSEGCLQAQFSDGSVQTYTEVEKLVEYLYELQIQPDEVRAIDWKVDIDRAPLSGTMIALYQGLRKKYREARNQQIDLAKRPEPKG
jgi:hypothetical protein